MKLDPSGWFYCVRCRSMEYRMPCCEGTTCNGGGCDKCDHLWEAAQQAKASGHAPLPTTEQIESAAEVRSVFKSFSARGTFPFHG